MSIQILFFASLKEKTKTPHVEIEWLPGETAAGIKNRLAKQFPDISTIIGTALVAVNREFMDETDEIPDGAEIAIFPPVSGGSVNLDIIQLNEEVIDINRVVSQVTLPTTGAVVFFTGMVRAETKRGEHQFTAALEYEAYLPMAEAKMSQIAREMREQWAELGRIVLIQRIGHLNVGDVAVVVACSASHRDSGAFEAARYGIDRLKEIVPVWKKETGPDGSFWVEGDYHPKKGE